MIVDEGYTTRENVLAADERGLDLIGGTMEKDAEAVRKGLEKRGLDPAFYPQNFRYDPETDTYTCPQGKRLSHRATRRTARGGGASGLPGARGGLPGLCLARGVSAGEAGAPDRAQ